MNDAPRLLIEWSSPWREFAEAIRPALSPSPPRLRMEARAGLFPARGMVCALLLEAVALATAIAHPARLVDPTSQSVSQAHDVIYFSADELPQTEDLGGAAAGSRGARGGVSQPHRSQVIRVARDERLREKITDAPHLNLPKSASQISNLLAFKADPVLPAPPALNALASRRREPALTIPVVPPTPELNSVQSRRKSPSALANQAVAPPPVALPSHDPVAHNSLPNVAVAPPPVSAPVEVASRKAQLTLPAETVAPPRPEIESAVQSRRMLSGEAPHVVPPPVEISDSLSKAPSLGNVAVAPPRPEVNASFQSRRTLGDSAPRVAPPPVEIADNSSNTMRSLGSVSVAPPRPDLPQDHEQERGRHDLGAIGVKAPAAAPSVASASAGVVLSARPGSQQATPAVQEKSTLAMAPKGSSNVGSGGQGGGQGIARGTGPGSSNSGEDSGGASSGTGKSTVEMARNTNSPYPGPSGAGILNRGNPRVPGVSVSGGKNVITLPSFGPTPDPASMGHSATPKSLGNGITVVASPRAGGALNLYGALKGDRVYTIYITTRVGTAVMQYADPSSAGHPYTNELVAPRPLRADVPASWTAAHSARVLIACELDRSGMLKNAHVLQSDDNGAAEKILAILSNWKFAPAFRGNDAVEVDAILGFGVDTR